MDLVFSAGPSFIWGAGGIFKGGGRGGIFGMAGGGLISNGFGSGFIPFLAASRSSAIVRTKDLALWGAGGGKLEVGGWKLEAGRERGEVGGGMGFGADGIGDLGGTLSIPDCPAERGGDKTGAGDFNKGAAGLGVGGESILGSSFKRLSISFGGTLSVPDCPAERGGSKETGFWSTGLVSSSIGFIILFLGGDDKCLAVNNLLGYCPSGNQLGNISFFSLCLISIAEQTNPHSNENLI
ncbi:MAG: hypothetical protein HY451_01800 [Parcubacteria group bacterium]|nr:hypothetical protein [Parcubacteria group bacterium]